MKTQALITASIFFSAWVVLVGRLIIPTRLNFSPATSYEAFAHIWLGACIMGFFTLPKQRFAFFWCGVLLSLIELFLVIQAKVL